MLVLLICLFAGAILPFAFAPFGIYPLAIFAPAVLLYVLRNAKPSKAFLLGWLFGIGFFGFGTYWIYISIHDYGNASIWLAGLITAIFILIMGLFYAVQSFLFTALFKNKSPLIQCLFAFPALWVLFEFLRSWLFTGFPWLLLGYSQTNSLLHGFAPIIGVYGISLITSLIAGCLCLVFLANKYLIKTTAVIIIVLSFLIGWLLSDKVWTQPIGKPIKATLVQGDIKQSIKWQPGYLQNILTTYHQLTAKHWDSHLIIWPEAAIPTFPQNVASFIQGMNIAAKTHNDYLITGIPIYHPKTKTFYNAMIILGAGQGVYLKRHLVPFGEYVPLTSIFGGVMKKFNIPMSNFSEGPNKQKTLQIGPYKIAPFICYEIAFPQLVLSSSIGKQIIVVITDDSWFGRSIALAQHLQIAAMSAQVTGRNVLLSSNSGYTAFINPLGQILALAPIDQKTTLTMQIRAMQGKTPIMIWGYYPIWILALLMFLFALVMKKPRDK